MRLFNKKNIFKIISLSGAKLIPHASVHIYEGDNLINSLKTDDGRIDFGEFAHKKFNIYVEASGFVSRELEIKDIISRKKIVLAEEGVIGYLSASPLIAGKSKLAIYVQSNVDWRFEVYRYSKEKTLVYSSDIQSPINQRIPNVGFSQSGLNWKPTLYVEERVLSVAGMYAVHLIDDLGGRVCLPFVANSERIKNDICVIANSSTWNMYNCWGGRSRYRNFEFYEETGREQLSFYKRLVSAILRRFLRLRNDLHEEDVRFCIESSWVTKELSLERPVVNQALLADSPYTPYLDHLAAHEWRFLSWLVENHFSYDYLQDNFIFNSEVDISKYRAIILVGHSEYWSKKDFLLLQNAYEAGVNILNLSGNSLYQQVEYNGDKTIKAVRKGFKSTKGVESMADYFWTDLRIKSFSPYRLNNGSLNEMLGRETLFDFQCLKLNQGYNAHFPVQTEATIFLKTGASGWEVDKIDERLKSKAVLLAKGRNDNGLGADIFYIPESEGGRGLFFSTSSIAFIASLLVDDDLSNLVKSVLKNGCHK